MKKLFFVEHARLRLAQSGMFNKKQLFWHPALE
jgi:hypothetical protein